MTSPTLTDALVADFDYDLPAALIAQRPLAERDQARLLVLDRASGQVTHSQIARLGDWLAPGDLMVANNSRVLPARLAAVKAESGGRVELLLLRPLDDGVWQALARPARRLRPGSSLLVQPRPPSELPSQEIVVTAIGDHGLVTVDLGALADNLAAYGDTPLPPYITERLAEPDRYQTVYASATGSAAAPTAGLHFTPALLADLSARGIGWAEVTLHVGLDTFRPVTVERAADHQIHQEWCDVPPVTAAAIAETKARGGRVVAVGTTSARTLETLASSGSDQMMHTGMTTMTDLFILPGYRWRMVDALLTNFHLPRSTLLMMISAFAGVEQVRHAYQVAIAERYRFYSFGDAMLIR